MVAAKRTCLNEIFWLRPQKVLAPQLTDSGKPTSEKLKENEMKYSLVTMGQVEAICNNLGGEKGVKRCLSGGFDVTFTPKKLAAWMTINLGEVPEKMDEYADNCAQRVLNSPSYVKDCGNDTVELVRVHPNVLCANIWSLDDIYKCAMGFGLSICPHKIGPLLRSRYLDQPEGTNLYIAMKPIITSRDYPRIFRLTTKRSEEYGVEYGDPYPILSTGAVASSITYEHEFVFMRRCEQRAEVL